MQAALLHYLREINALYEKTNATEHTYRPALKTLVETLCPYVEAINEPKRKAHGAPDFEIKQRKIHGLDIGSIETKKIDDGDLKGERHNKEQFDRYKKIEPNIIFTDYLEFYFYHEDLLEDSVRIAEIKKGKIIPIKDNFEKFRYLLDNFSKYELQIKKPEELARRMAKTARMLAAKIEDIVRDEKQETDGETNELIDMMRIFKEHLIANIDAKTFANMYAQTVAYGFFVARYHSEKKGWQEPFTRRNAAQLIPTTNPFLRKFFGYIEKENFDESISRYVDRLADILRCSNPAHIIDEYKKQAKEEPIIHFYETFLAAYNPEDRKNRGVWYTPKPVVQFIVGAVDEVLKTDFNLREGLADTSKITKNEKPYHKVQILDPATGSGTFLAELVRYIYKHSQQGTWNNYVEEHLIPRLHGFELLMASYAIAHINMDLLLDDTKYTGDRERLKRFQIFLTNSLEGTFKDENEPSIPLEMFIKWLIQETKGANEVKRNKPVMVIIGNPPYSGESQNNKEVIHIQKHKKAKMETRGGKEISADILNITQSEKPFMDMLSLMQDYKKEPEGKVKLKERNSKWINDDYVKFIRYGQYFVEKNGSGIVAYINPHGYLDNPTFRGMRWHLLHTYDKIYTIDLHGNARKKECAPDGTKDENVFDIMQGVSINLFIKTGKKKQNELAEVFHHDLYGTREHKFEYLRNNSLAQVPFKKIAQRAPDYFFVPKNFDLLKNYQKGFSVSELFMLNSVGIVTARDNFTIHHSKEAVKKTIDEFLNVDDQTARDKFNLGKDTRDWQVNFARIDLNNNYPNKGYFTNINYRPFDERWTFYTGKTKGFICMPRGQVMQHFLLGENTGLIIGRQGQVVGSMPWNLSFITNKITDINLYYRGGGTTYPLYIYPNEKDKSLKKKIPNLKEEIVKKIATCAKMLYKEERAQNLNTLKNTPPPPNIFHLWIYWIISMVCFIRPPIARATLSF